VRAMRRPADVQRVRYWSGQQLRSGDLRAQGVTEDELRWWHNRAVHAAYGVVDGLGVTSAPPGYSVAPGLAYDGYGRELLIPCPVTAPPPCKTRGEQPTTWTLLIAYDAGADASSCTRDEIDGACVPAGRCPGNDRIHFFWVPRAVEGDCAGVPLARILRTDTTYYTLDPSYVPPAVRPLAQPRVATGQTPPGDTAWEEWTELDDPGITDDRTLFGFQVAVDTSAGGFVKTPCYFAWLKGSRVWRSPDPSGGQTMQTNWWLPFDWIVDAAPSGFTFRVLVVDGQVSVQGLLNLRNFLTFVRCYDIHICWIGVEERNELPYDWCEECCA